MKTIKDIQETHPETYKIFSVMFYAVGAPLNMGLHDNWFLGYQWSKHEEDGFRAFLVKALKSTKLMKELAGHKCINLGMRKKIADAFIYQYGWNVNDSNNINLDL